MKYVKMILRIILGGFTLFILGLLFLTPTINDHVAEKVARNIKAIELPSNAEYMESFSIAGKITGNGNGMQYLGGIVIKSDESLQDLQTYYSQYDKGKSTYIVEKQDTFLQHAYIKLNAHVPEESYYIVYSWGYDDSIFSELDLRGH